MLKRKGLVGVVGGVVLAMVGPAGLAIGHFGHPVGEASHPEAGAMFGTVVASDTQEPLEGVCVSIEPASWSSYSPSPQLTSHSRPPRPPRVPRYAYRQTDQDGHYFSSDLRPGRYRVRFDTSCSTSTVRNLYASEWAHGARRLIDSGSIRVVQGQTSILNADLDPAGTLRGSVVDEVGDAPSTCVTAYLDDTDQFDVRWPDAVRQIDNEVVARGNVEDGQFRLRGLPAGDYRLLVGCLTDDWATETPAPFGYLPAWAPVVSLPAAGDVTADVVTIAGAGSITGKVVDQFGRKRKDACIDAWTSSSKSVGGSSAYSGAFDGARVPAGTYRVSATQDWCESWDWGYGDIDFWYAPFPGSWHPFDRTWFEDSATYGGATEVAVVARKATRTDMTVHLVGPDLNVTRLDVTDPTIKTAFTEIPSPGVRKEIRITVREDGIVRPSWYWPYYPESDRTRVRLAVWAVSHGSRLNSWDLISSQDFDLGQAEARDISISWTPAGSIGDLDIVAKACVATSPYFYYPSYSLDGDVFQPNNVRIHETFVGVGGLGGASGLVPAAPWGAGQGC